MGSTGTASLALALYRLGITARHGTGNTLPRNGTSTSPKWALGRQMSNLKVQYSRNDPRCHQAFDALKYKLSRGEAVVDEPTPEAVVDLWRANPNAKVILTVRPADAWVRSRRQKSLQVRPPLQRPCGLFLSDVRSDAQLAALYGLHNQLVRCIIPSSRLLEIHPVPERATTMTRWMKPILWKFGNRHRVPGCSAPGTLRRSGSGLMPKSVLQSQSMPRFVCGTSPRSLS